MSVARVRALTRADISLLTETVIFVEMSVARVRALTRMKVDFRDVVFCCRNECCPCEGIDTFSFIFDICSRIT